MNCGQAPTCFLESEVERLTAENARLRREILAAGKQDFDWSVLERLDRLELAEANLAALRTAVRPLAEKVRRLDGKNASPRPIPDCVPFTLHFARLATEGDITLGDCRRLAALIPENRTVTEDEERALIAENYPR